MGWRQSAKREKDILRRTEVLLCVRGGRRQRRSEVGNERRC